MNYLEEAINTLSKLGPEMFCIVACIAVGYLVRVVPFIPNKWIPSICILAGMFIYPGLTSTGRVSPDAQIPIVRMWFTGLILGALAFAIHDQALSRLEKYIPGLRKVLRRSDDTKQFKRDHKGEVTENKPSE